MNKKTKPLVSVVTPFYNTEDYLAECIESVLAQTYQNWEYILVNNCSTDGSPEIAKRFADQDQRVRLIHNERLLPQVENYNHALRQISPESEYCKIVQADDWIFPSCIEEMVQAAELAPNVALVGSYSIYEPLPGYSDRTYLGHFGLPYTCRVVPGVQMLRRYLGEYLCLFGSPTCVMFRTSDILARSDFFNLGSPVEDIEACFEVLQSGDFAFVHQVLTFNRRQNGSYWWNMSDYNADALNKVILTYLYGPKLFEPEEFARLLRRVKSEHYLCLGHALLERRPAAYWRHHVDGLARVGQKIQKLHLVLYTLRALLNFIGNPKATLGRLIRSHQWENRH
jgi:glycosyltransferase involved in cell wall biosynthesis